MVQPFFSLAIFKPIGRWWHTSNDVWRVCRHWRATPAFTKTWQARPPQAYCHAVKNAPITCLRRAKAVQWRVQCATGGRLAIKLNNVLLQRGTKPILRPRANSNEAPSCADRLAQAARMSPARFHCGVIAVFAAVRSLRLLYSLITPERSTACRIRRTVLLPSHYLPHVARSSWAWLPALPAPLW